MMKKQFGIWLVLLCLIVVGAILIWIDNPIVVLGSENDKLRWSAGLLLMCLLVLILDGVGALGTRKLAHAEFAARLKRSFPQILSKVPTRTVKHSALEHMREQHGLLWRRKMRVLLVVGNPLQVDAIAPGLIEQTWLESHDTVLLFAGSLQEDLDEVRLATWQGLLRWRGADGVVWALNSEQCKDESAMRVGSRRLQQLAKRLGWQLPLHLWQVCESHWPQTGRPVQPVGCRLSTRCTAKRMSGAPCTATA